MSDYSKLKLLLVEDHLALREVFSEFLTSQGHQVCAHESAEQVLALSAATAFDLALLDLNLPGEDGLYLAEKLRMQSPNIGIIMLTARNSIEDKLAGYTSGADIYLPKPVSPEELNAAIQAVCRRIPKLNHKDLTLYFLTNQLANLQTDITPICLSIEETRLLTILSQAPQQQLEIWELAENLDLDLDSNTLRATLEKRVSRLRKKLVALAQPASSIKFIRGYGYKLTVSIEIV
ncbi:response regulator transcription factor [Thiomicrospira microaerophila]|uniref:response regulator transcription factor n=1 Tax=Thiomicrospira microaerophila TaxID=406020 RepID=UPI0005C9E1CD|nr:response regulator transcription factor [Thiomicrospira microaerophila]